LRIRGMRSDAAKLEENRSTNGLSNEAARIVREEGKDMTRNEEVLKESISICQHCVWGSKEGSIDMYTTYCIPGPCDRCGRMADLAMVREKQRGTL
jgi:hypothetical protein